MTYITLIYVDGVFFSSPKNFFVHPLESNVNHFLIEIFQFTRNFQFLVSAVMSDASQKFVVVISSPHPPFKCFFGMEFSFLLLPFTLRDAFKSEKRVEIVQIIGKYLREMRKI